MKIYGENLFRYPRCNRIVWDFEDGPFETLDPVLIAEAKRLGFGMGAPVAPKPVEVKIVEVEAPKVEETPAPKPRRGRKSK